MNKSIIDTPRLKAVEMAAPSTPSSGKPKRPKMNVNGTDYTKNYLRHEELFKGGIIKVDMSNQPNMNRGTKEEDMPYSFSKEQ